MHTWNRCCAAHSVVLALRTSQRFARARGGQKAAAEAPPPRQHHSLDSTIGASSTASPTMPAGMLKRQSGFVAADTPSIASIRAELDALRRDKLFAAQVRAEASAAKAQRAAGGADSAAKARHANPKFVLAPPAYSLQDKQLSEGIAANASLHDKRLRNDVQDVVRRRRASDSVKLASLAGQLHTTAGQSKREAALHALTARVDATLQAYAVGAPTTAMAVQDMRSSDPLYEAALLEVVDKAAPDEVLEWLRFGLVDPLWWATPPPSDGDVPVPPLREGDKGGRETENVQGPEDPLSEWLADADPLRILSVSHAANSYSSAAVHALRLKDVPPPDIAPAVIKADQGDFASITEREIRSLEAHESQNANLVGRAFTPSSPLIAALSTVDDKLKASLEVLERIKRDTLLDTSFQAALDYVNALHDARHAAIEHVNPRQRKAAAEVPFFFGSNRSQPPPAADMNLPAPKASPEERASLRRKRKLHRLRKRFSM